MTVDWTTSPLEELSINFDGKRRPVKEADRRPGPYPYYGASGIVDHVDDYIFDGEHLLVAEDGENLRTRQTPIAFLAKGKFWVNNHAHILTGNEKTDTRFLMYALRHINIDAYLTGAVMPKLTQRNLNRIEVPHPNLAEQRAIAAVLSALDDKIEQNRRTARVLERLARAIFRAWFVDIEPVKAKGEGATSFPSMPQELFDALPTRLIDSKIGPVPEGWEVGPISNVCTLSKDQLKPIAHPEEVFDHFSIPAFDSGAQPVVESGAGIKSAKFLVTKSCVMISKLNPRIPRVWLPDVSPDRRGIASTEFLVLEPNHGWSRSYIYSQLHQEEFLEDMAQRASGTSNSHQRVKPKDFIRTQIPMPPASFREEFNKTVKPLLDLVQQGRHESRKLAETRDYLLSRLLNAEVRIPETKLIAEEMS